MNRPTIQAFHGSNSTESLQVSGRQEYELGTEKKKKKRHQWYQFQKAQTLGVFTQNQEQKRRESIQIDMERKKNLQPR